jgi:predicted negative regulator of RcsB-dependent stress response
MPSIKVQLKSEKPEGEKKKRSLKPLKPSKRGIAEFVVLVLLVVVGTYAWHLRTDRNDLQSQVASLKSNPQQAVQEQTNTLIASVGKLISLPQSETPTVAAVTNAAQAKQQSAFFNNAQNGDKVLLYVKAGEAILYRPSTNKIIVVAPLTFSNSTASGTTTSTSTTTAKK